MSGLAQPSLFGRRLTGRPIARWDCGAYCAPSQRPFCRPYLEVHKSGDLLFLPLSVGVMLVVGDRGRDHRLTTRSVSEFGIVGEVSGHVDCVDVHYGDLGFWFVLVSTFYALLCYM